MSAKKQTIKRACIDCHFLAHDHIDIDENPDDIRLNTANTIKRTGLLPFYRKQIKEREDSFCSGSDQWLGCYFEHWCGATVFVEKSKYKVVLETERNDCPDFFEYRGIHSFKYVEELLSKRKWRAPLRVAGQSNKTEAGESKKHQAKRVSHKKGKLKRGERQPNIPNKELFPFVEKDLKFLTSSKGGGLEGGALAKRIMKDIENRFDDKYGDKAKYKLGTVKNLISKINTGRK